MSAINTTTTTTTTSTSTSPVALLTPTIFQVVQITKKQQQSYDTACRAVDATDLATSGNRTLQTFGLSLLKQQQLEKAVANIAKGQFTPACLLVDSWLSHEFGALVGRDQKSLSEYLASAALKIAALKAIKTIERKTLALDLVGPISNALMARLTLKC